jgi:histidyl-tRNA synthetase
VKIGAPRGTRDVLPADQPPRRRIIEAAESAAARYGYRRITIPTFEETELFARTSGQGSDVVAKEMYTFEDRSGRSLTLRPEATAGIGRAYVEHGLHRAPQPVKTFTIGPMFRYAAPQKGRYREFWQLDFEAMGSDDPAIDAELIELFVQLARSLEIAGLRLELNSIGDRVCRPAYVERLRAFLEGHERELDEEARRKARTSPLRVFDTKSDAVAQVLAAAPVIGDWLCEGCRRHFEEVRAYLDAYGVEYRLAPRLVRGLDYYTRTVFEFVNDALDAAQATVCAGGRYDYLIEEIGGRPTPAVGWAAGLERLVLSLPEQAGEAEDVDVFFVLEEGADRPRALAQMALLRRAGRRCETDYAGRSVKGQLTQAGRLRARTIVRVERDRAVIRDEAGEREVAVAAIAEALTQ